MKKILIISLIFSHSPLFSMETGVSLKETSSWKYLHDGDVAVVAPSGSSLLVSDEKNGPRIVFVEHNKAKDAQLSHKGADVFSRPQSGAHAAFNAPATLCAAVLHYPRTSRPHALALFDVQSGKSLPLSDKIFVSGKGWESGAYCNSLIWLSDDMLGIFSSGDPEEAKKGISESFDRYTNTLNVYAVVCDDSGHDLFLQASHDFNKMLLRAAQVLQGGVFALVHDDKKDEAARSVVRVFFPGKDIQSYDQRSYVFPKRFSSMGRVHLSYIADSGMLAVGASTEQDIYLLDASSVSCLARLTITDPLVSLCASPLKSYLLLVTEPQSTALYTPKTVSLLMCSHPKKAKIAMSDECSDKKDAVSWVSWTGSNEILMKRDSGLYGVALNVLMAKGGKNTVAIRKNSSHKNLMEKLRGSLEKLLN